MYKIPVLSNLGASTPCSLCAYRLHCTNHGYLSLRFAKILRSTQKSDCKKKIPNAMNLILTNGLADFWPIAAILLW
jgi:hypothetical protein